MMEAWTKTWLVKVNETKTTYTVFSLSNKDHKVKLQINDYTLQAEDSPTYLGITLDRHLTWKKHLPKTQAKAKQRLNLILN